jgi:hypothetical protein
MPYFEIAGYGQATKRKRRRTYLASDESEARGKAAQDGTVVEQVTLVEIFGFLEQLAGASHKNPDNTSRQRLLRNCQPHERLVFEHEIWGQHPNATKVCRLNGEQLGYLPEDIARVVM